MQVHAIHAHQANRLSVLVPRALCAVFLVGGVVVRTAGAWFAPTLRRQDFLLAAMQRCRNADTAVCCRAGGDHVEVKAGAFGNACLCRRRMVHGIPASNAHSPVDIGRPTVMVARLTCAIRVHEGPAVASIASFHILRENQWDEHYDAEPALI